MSTYSNRNSPMYIIVWHKCCLSKNNRDTVDEHAEREDAAYTKWIQIRTRVEDNAVVIEVEDNGVGMDEATRQRLFEPFLQQRIAHQGTGLWLGLFTKESPSISNNQRAFVW